MIRVAIHTTSRFPCTRSILRECVKQAFAKHDISSGEVSISLVGTRKMTELNEELMKHEGVTDVLSFPQFDPEQPDKHFPGLPSSQTAGSVKDAQNPTPLHHFGDIVVCYPVARTQAGKKGKMVDDQLCFLVDHGIQHLLGFHHD